MTQLLLQLTDKTYPCEITRSNRARYLRLKLSHSGTLSVIVPNGVSLEAVNRFVTSQAQWVERKLNDFPVSNIHAAPLTQLELTYLNEVWSIDYLPDAAAHSIIVEATANGQLACRGCTQDIPLLHKALGMWLKAKAEQVIPQRLERLAKRHGFHFNRVTIRGQKTRWGSCSSKKNINLNYKLLFLEAVFVDYVLLHELCHTIEMNHSRKFWDLLASCDSHYKLHDKQLNQLSRSLPL